MVARMLGFFCWTVNNSEPDVSSSTSVSRNRNAFPDLERALAGVVLDPEVVADREHLLEHPVLRSAVPAAAAQQRHREPPFRGAYSEGSWVLETSVSVASRRARVGPGPLALAGAPSGVEGDRAVGQERLLLRDRRRRTTAAVRPDRPAARARRARGGARHGGRADGPLARARHAEPRGAARRAGVHAAAR